MFANSLPWVCKLCVLFAFYNQRIDAVNNRVPFFLILVQAGILLSFCLPCLFFHVRQIDKTAQFMSRSCLMILGSATATMIVVPWHKSLLTLFLLTHTDYYMIRCLQVNAHILPLQKLAMMLFILSGVISLLTIMMLAPRQNIETSQIWLVSLMPFAGEIMGQIVLTVDSVLLMMGEQYEKFINFA